MMIRGVGQLLQTVEWPTAVTVNWSDRESRHSSRSGSTPMGVLVGGGAWVVTLAEAKLATTSIAVATASLRSKKLAIASASFFLASASFFAFWPFLIASKASRGGQGHTCRGVSGAWNNGLGLFLFGGSSAITGEIVLGQTFHTEVFGWNCSGSNLSHGGLRQQPGRNRVLLEPH